MWKRLKAAVWRKVEHNPVDVVERHDPVEQHDPVEHPGPVEPHVPVDELEDEHVETLTQLHDQFEPVHGSATLFHYPLEAGLAVDEKNYNSKEVSSGNLCFFAVANVPVPGSEFKRYSTGKSI